MVKVKKVWEFILVFVRRNRAWSLIVVVVSLLGLGAWAVLKSNVVALAQQAAAPIVATVAKAPVAPIAPVAKAPVIAAPIVAAPVVAPKEPVAVPQQARVAEEAVTILQVGGAEEIIKDWHNKDVATVKLPVLTDLNIGWENVHQTGGKTTYWVAISSDKGIYTYSGVDYKFDEGFVAVVMTETPESIAVTTGWNGISISGPKPMW